MHEHTSPQSVIDLNDCQSIEAMSQIAAGHSLSDCTFSFKGITFRVPSGTDAKEIFRAGR